MRVSDVVDIWMRERGVSEKQAIDQVLQVLKDHPQCLTVSCDNPVEINRGIPESVKHARREQYITEMGRIHDRRQLSAYNLRCDRFADALARSRIYMPYFVSSLRH
jgi:hypothetical protein